MVSLSKQFFIARGSLKEMVGSEWRKCGFPITLRSCGSGGEEGLIRTTIGRREQILTAQ